MFCLGVFSAITFSGALTATPLLRCQLRQSDMDRVVEFVPVKNPYTVEAVDVNNSFRFKAVVIGNEHHIEYIKLYAYYMADGHAVLMHEAKYFAPVVQRNASVTALTGLNFLFSPILGREFQYGCSLFEVNP